MFISWLIVSIFEEMFSVVVKYDTTIDIWVTLQSHFVLESTISITQLQTTL